MQISGFYRVKKHPPHSKRGGCFFVFVKILNLMTLPAGAGPCFSVLNADRADGTAVPGLLGRVQQLRRDLAAVGEAIVAHGEDLRTGTGAQAAADAGFIDSCFHRNSSDYSMIFPSRPSVTTCQGMNLPLCRRAVSTAR